MGLYRGYKGIMGLYRGYKGIMGLYRGYKGIMEKNMETTIVFRVWGLGIRV